MIDDESTTRRNTDDLSIPLCRSAKREILGVVARHHAVGTGRVGAAVKPVGKLDVRNGHVQFDERGRETIGAYVARSSALPRLYAWLFSEYPRLLLKDAQARQARGWKP